MGTTTRKASKAPRKRTPSRRAQENAPSPPPQRKKRAKHAAFINPHENAADAPSNDQQLDTDAIAALDDVSTVEYTLSTSVMLDDISIYADTSFYKLREFNFRKFEINAIKRLDKATLKSKAKFEWDIGHAIISAKGVTKPNELPVELEEAIHWDKVEQFLERWIRAKKREIAVKLVLYYKKTDSDDIDSDPEEDLLPRGRKVRSSVMLILEHDQ